MDGAMKTRKFAATCYKTAIPQVIDKLHDVALREIFKYPFGNSCVRKRTWRTTVQIEGLRGKKLSAK